LSVSVHHGDCRDVLATLPEASIDACVTDPPYGLGFMGKEWDTPGALVERKPDRSVKWDKVGGNHNPTDSADAARTRRAENRKFQEWCDSWLPEVFRVLKPGAHVLAFGGTRTYHRLVCAIEDAGFEIRDQIGWAYGSGFPKSLDVSKAIDKAAGAEREVVGRNPTYRKNQLDAASWTLQRSPDLTAPSTPEAATWEGWGTAFKPAWEPIVVARKPLIGTVASNVLAHGTGAINIDGCRVAAAPGDKGDWPITARSNERGSMAGPMTAVATDHSLGRWPANLVHDGSDEVLACFPETGKSTGGKGAASGLIDNAGIYGAFSGENKGASAGGFGDTGSAARFFYCAKASKSERGEGNIHPTVKPVALMRWLVRIVTPPGGVVLDPFAGSGTTGLAAMAEGFSATLIEADAPYADIIASRLRQATPVQGTLI
jgi:site-specific DNA-methyltransferase (adenine-specific)